MVRSHSRYVATVLPSGNLLVADASSLPQDLFLVTPGEFSKHFTEPVTQELSSEKLLKRRISLSPDLEFQIERFTVSQHSNICAIGRHCLAILQPIGDVHGYGQPDSFIFRCYPVCRYMFHPKSSVELVHVTFVSPEKQFLSVLSTDCTLRLFDTTQLSAESLLAPFRTINLLYPQRNVGTLSTKKSITASSRISLAKCEPFVSIAYLNEASVMAALETPSRSEHVESSHVEVLSQLPFMALRSNGDVYLGFVDLSSVQPTFGSPSSINDNKGVYDCQLAGPLKMQMPECDSANEGARLDNLNACSMQVVSGANFAKGVPLVIIASANGSIGHYLLMTEPDSNEKHQALSSTCQPAGTPFDSKSSLTLHFPSTSLFAIERLLIACPKLAPSTHHSLTGWLYDPNCLAISPCPYDGTFSYFATVSSSVFRVFLPWLEASLAVSDSAFVTGMEDGPTFVESLLSLGSQSESVTVGYIAQSNAVLVAVGRSLYGVPTCAKVALDRQQQLPSLLEYQSPIFVFPPPEVASEEVLPPSEDFVAVVQRALARQANLNPKLLSTNIPGSKETGNDDPLSNLYLAATASVALLAREYFGRTDTAARQLTRLQSTCDVRLRHVTGTIEKRLSKSCTEFGTKVIPTLANRIDSIADRMAILVQRLGKLSEISRNSFPRKSSDFEEVCVKEGFTNQLTDIDVNLAHITALYGEVDEKASYLASQITAFTERDLSAESDSTTTGQQQPPPSSLLPLFESLGGDIRRIADELRCVKEEVERIDTHVRF